MPKTNTDEEQTTSSQTQLTQEELFGQLTIERAKDDVRKGLRALGLGLVSATSFLSRGCGVLGKGLDVASAKGSEALGIAYDKLDDVHKASKIKPD